MTELQESVTEDVNQDGQGSRAGRVRRFFSLRKLCKPWNDSYYISIKDHKWLINYCSVSIRSLWA